MGMNSDAGCGASRRDSSAVESQRAREARAQQIGCLLQSIVRRQGAGPRRGMRGAQRLVATASALSAQKAELSDRQREPAERACRRYRALASRRVRMRRLPARGHGGRARRIQFEGRRCQPRLCVTRRMCSAGMPSNVRANRPAEARAAAGPVERVVRCRGCSDSGV